MAELADRVRDRVDSRDRVELGLVLGVRVPLEVVDHPDPNLLASMLALVRLRTHPAAHARVGDHRREQVGGGAEPDQRGRGPQ